MTELPEIASLWIGGKLSWLEQLCLKSFADHGHHITLYSYSPIPNVPPGVHTADAAEIYPGEPMLRHARTGSPAIHADMWRLNLLKKTDKIWVDADMFCYKPFDYSSPFVFGWEKPGLVCNAVLGLPSDSKTLNSLLDFFKDEYAIAPWLKPYQIAELEAERDAGKPVHMTEQTWGFTGPSSVTHFLIETGEIEHAQPEAAFYPLSFKERNQLILGKLELEDDFSEETRGVHFWARRVKPRLEEKENNRPRPGSFIDAALKVHEIDPEMAPIPRKRHNPNNNVPINDPAFQAEVGEAALKGGWSIDKICRDFLVDKRFVRQCAQRLKNREIGPDAVSEKFGGLDVNGLDVSMFAPGDLVNLILQRSEVLTGVHRPGQIIREWSAGKTEAIDEIVSQRGTEIAREAARVIGREFEDLRALIEGQPPKRIADIGCGYAIFELFAARSFGSEVLLIDLEENDKRHFGFQEEGAAYANLDKARRFLLSNEVPEQAVETLNPGHDDLMAAQSVDLAVSFVACGFHFPVDVYMPFFRDKVSKGGRILLDLRKNVYDPQAELLSELGELRVVEETPKRRRVLVTKTG